MILKNTPTLYSEAEAAEVAETLNNGELAEEKSKRWTYKVESLETHNYLFHVAVYDETGAFVDYFGEVN